MRRLLIVLVVPCLLAGCSSLASPHPAVTPDLQNDPRNCGAVGFQVPVGEVCHNGVAQPPG